MSDFHTESGRIGKKGVFTIPATFRKRFGLVDGSLVIAEECQEGILLRPAVAMPVEVYSDQKIASLLLSNAVDAEDYEAALSEIRMLGIDPDKTPHRKPL